MLKSLKSRLDQFGRHHPGLMFAVTLLAALATTLILILFPQGQEILYKAF